MSRKTFLLFWFYTLCCFSSTAQPYVEGGKTRHRFAQLNLGLDYRMFPGTGSQSAIINEGQIQNFELKDQGEVRLLIGGTHFWGHADFYLAIPVATVGSSGFTTGVETGAKYFPFRIEDKKLRPYLGIAFLPTGFQQGDGTNMIRFKYPVTAGLVYNQKRNLFELGFGYNYNNSDEYYISTTTSTQIKTQPYWISLGYKFMIETTISAERYWQSGRTKTVTDSLAHLNKLNGFTLAVGSSTAVFLKSSSHNDFTAPYVDDHRVCDLFPEFGVGYYLNNPDIQFNLAYRNMKSNITAYDFSQDAKCRAITFESYKFLTDYHGFAAFAGIALSYEQLRVTETSQETKAEYNAVKPGIVFGWDIRPNRLQNWYLRTNLRYFPNMNVTMPDKKDVPFDQLEINFIQLVLFPGRMF